MGGGPFVDLGKLAEPATRLIDRISDAVEGIARPHQIRRIAKAEVDAEIIRAEGRLRLSEIQQRALARMVHEEGVKQANIEQITYKALPHLKTNARPEAVEVDWLRLFFERSRLISNEEMQTMWARLLASEANEPGKHSRKCIETFAVLERRDAELVTKFGQMCWQMLSTTLCLVFVDGQRGSQYSALNITFDELVHLESLGLIRFEPLGGYQEEVPSPSIVGFYYGRPLHIEGYLGNFQTGVALLTEVGREMIAVCGSKPSRTHYDFIVQQLMGQGFVVSTPLVENMPRSWAPSETR